MMVVFRGLAVARVIQIIRMDDMIRKGNESCLQIVGMLNLEISISRRILINLHRLSQGRRNRG